ncbi:MAG: DUF6516 family protein [Desulfatirhabdiaceae bacterium]
MKALLEHHTKVIEDDGSVIEIKIWRVPASAHAPHGFKYSLVFVKDGKRVVGYDNERGKGDHRHFWDQEHPYTFTDVETLFRDFQADMTAAKKGRP